ncbi:MAG TPA: YajG family lipoprotein [Permianibacter sp.]|nr:YajG family lipoprotein [Permianibacter sp.]
MSLSFRTLVPVLTLFLAACANGPSKMLLDPEVRSMESQLGSGHSVQLQVSGNPTAAALQEGQSRFELERPATVTVREKVATGLMRHGFQLADAGVDRRFVVEVLKADHVVSRGIVRDTINVETELRFSAITPAGTRTRAFVDKRSREVGGRATLGEVSGELNQSLGHVMARGLNDAELMAFLSQQ